MNQDILKKRIQKQITQIKRLRESFDNLSNEFRKNPDSFNEWCEYEWCKNIFGNGLIRLRQITKQNFFFIETISLLATTRYIFELSVWLYLVDKDAKYGLVYYWELLETQLKYYRDTLKQLHREINLLNKFDQKDRQATLKATLNIFKSIVEDTERDFEISDAIRRAMTEVDIEAYKKFSIYIDDAKINGYGFQAYLVETKAIPQVQRAIAEIEKKLSEFQLHVDTEIMNIIPKRWNWRQMAQKVGKEEEYDYIYTYTSKLIHATPASLTTNQKNLELSEVYIFLRYIYVNLCEIIALAKKQLKII